MTLIKTYFVILTEVLTLEKRKVRQKNTSLWENWHFFEALACHSIYKIRTSHSFGLILDYVCRHGK